MVQVFCPLLIGCIRSILHRVNNIRFSGLRALVKRTRKNIDVNRVIKFGGKRKPEIEPEARNQNQLGLLNKPK